ncbi:MAG: hypothetical protein AB8B82_01750 [Roseovarius sp.]
MRLSLPFVLCLVSLAPAASAQSCPDAFQLIGWPGPDGPQRQPLLEDFEGGQVLLTMADVTSAQQIFDQNNAPAVSFSYTAEASKVFGLYTAEHIGMPIAIVYDGELMSTPIIMSAIYGQQAIVNGLNTVEEANEMAQALTTQTCPPGAGS